MRLFPTPPLPAASIFWRYAQNLRINQAKSILKVSSALRERGWQLCALRYRKAHLSIDTIAETVSYNQQESRRNLAKELQKYAHAGGSQGGLAISEGVKKEEYRRQETEYRIKNSRHSLTRLMETSHDHLFRG